MTLSIIVAASFNRVIGVDNQLPWHLPADLKYFKSLTTNHTILMGRKTFASIGKPLPNRENIVITRDQNFHVDGVLCMHSIEEALAYCANKEEEVFIIGGDTIYKQTLGLANKVYRTKVHTSIDDGTAYFPTLKVNEWDLISSEYHEEDDKNEYDYTFEVYVRHEK